MGNNKKTVHFDHLCAYYLDTTSTDTPVEHLYDLKALWANIKNRPFIDTQKRIFGDFHRIHKCSYDKDRKLWEIQILHLREKVLPGIADDNGSYELIHLDATQVPAESTTLLYNEQNCTIYLQRNIYGTSIKALEAFIQLVSPPNITVLLKPKIQGNQLSKIVDSSLYRKVILVADTEQLTTREATTSLSKTLKAFESYQGRIVKIELGFGRGVGRLKSNETAQLIREAYNYPGTQHLETRTAYDEDTAFESINLLDDRSKYVVSLEYSRENPIIHSRLYSACLMKFDEEYSTT